MILRNIDLKVLEQAIEEGMRYPKVTVYNPIVAGFMRYMEIKTPRFKTIVILLTFYTNKFLYPRS